MKLLILGGTSDGKQLAQALHEQGITVIYSIAGLVRQPDLPCDIISGGFSKRGGLARYVIDNDITALLDATHPFADKMSQIALDVSAQLNLTLWRYQRPDWIATPEDDWTFYEDWRDLLSALAPYQSIFLTQGQLSESMLDALHLHRQSGQQFLHRTAVKPKHQIPEWMTWVQGIGPFSLDAEMAAIKNSRVEVIVSKHSGGSVPNKMLAARELGIPALLLARPNSPIQPETGNVYTDIAALVDEISRVADVPHSL